MANALLGVLCLLLFRRLLRCLPGFEREAGWAADLAMIYLAFAPGFWWAATRAGPSLIAYVMLAVIALWTIQCFRSPDTRRASGLSAAVLTGWVAVEYPAAGCLAPIPLFALLAAHGTSVGFWRWFSWIAAGTIAGCLAGAGALMLRWLPVWPAESDVSLIDMVRLAGAAWRETADRQWPDIGWLAVATTVLCSLALALPARMRTRRRARRRTVLVQAGLLAVLCGLPFIPPHRLDAFQPVDGRLILPWIGLAIAFGACADFLCGRFRRRSVPYGALVALLLGGAVWRLPYMTARPAGALEPVWSAVLAGARDGDWMISDGWMDAPLWLAAREKGVEPLFIHPGMSGHPPYRAWLVDQMTEARYRSLAAISPVALVSDRLAGPPDEGPNLFFLSYPERIVLSGQALAPRMARYEAARPDQLPPPSGLLREHEAFWSVCEPALDRLARRRDEHGRMAHALQRHLSRIANDLGVVMEHRGRADYAALCYERALAFNPDNLSARINRELAATGGVADSALARRLQRECGPGLPGRLARESGFVFSRRALYWIGGLCGLLDPEELPHELVQDIARAYLSGDPANALDRAEAAVAQFPASRSAWMLLGALAFETGDEWRLERALDQMQRRDERWAPLLMALGRRAMEHEDYPRAATLLGEAHAMWPLNIRIMEALIQLDLHLRDDRSLERHMRDLLAIDPWNPWANFALGLRHVRDQEPDLAESALRRAIGGRPFPVAYNNLAWLLHERGRLSDALFYARRAVELDPYAWAHWDTLGAILMELEAWDAAGEALRAALTLNPDNGETRARADAWSAATGRILPLAPDAGDAID